ncbi:MAG: Cyclic pyranopterin monophosphate synthase, partial [Alphaproteobacteria bacterium MarineAlpha10_Bin1]
MLIDPFERHVSYLRVSVTDRCDFRCVYCMSEHMTFLPKAELLSLEELDRLCSAFITLGVKKLRVSGGEPLVRRGIMTLFKSLGRHLDSGALEELTLTTNGSQLARYANELVDYGVRRVNVSLDTLDEANFVAITRWGKYDKVMAGIEAAQAAGLRVKINTVALNGVNDGEIEELVRWCGEKDLDLTYIETMPMGEIDGDRSEQYLPLTQVRARMAETWTLDENDHDSGGPARYVTLRETGQRV